MRLQASSDVPEPLLGAIEPVVGAPVSVGPRNGPASGPLLYLGPLSGLAAACGPACCPPAVRLAWVSLDGDILHQPWRQLLAGCRAVAVSTPAAQAVLQRELPGVPAELLPWDPAVPDLADRLRGWVEGAVGAIGPIGRRGHTRPVEPKTPPVAAIVTCHNYQRYLGLCLQSLVTQRRPFNRIVVLDDASDDPAAVAAVVARFPGIQFHRVAYRDACRARDHGLSVTTETLLVFVDADNALGPRFLERLLPLLADRRAALAYAPARLIDEQSRELGRYASIRATTHDELRRENRIDTCCLVRRDAVLDAGGWGPGAGPGRYHDWNLWLRVTGLGWTARYLDEPLWSYRRHHASMSSRQTAELDHQVRVEIMRRLYHVAVVTPFCGREWALERTLAAYRDLGWDPARLHLLAIDNSRDEAFGRLLRRRLEETCGGWASTTVVRDDTPGPEGASPSRFAAEAILRMRHEEQLGRTIRRIYAETVALLLGQRIDLVLTLEDDVEVTTPEPLPRLLQALRPETMAVGGMVNIRYTDRTTPGPIAWQVISEEPYQARRAEDPGPGAAPFPVDGLAYGCTLWRAEAWRSLMPRRLRANDSADTPPWHDLTFVSDIRRAGYQMLLDPQVRTRHWREDGSFV